jgi:hypothetical protein
MELSYERKKEQKERAEKKQRGEVERWQRV